MEKTEFGKTTLIREIIKGDNKDITINPSINIAYFRQNLDNLNPEKSVIENVMQDSIQTQTTIRNILGNLNIRNDDIYKLTRDLSGGEKVKVSLTKIILSDANFLILDEPTNFLDIQAIESLEEMLKVYKGTVLLVSHDKSFIDSVVDNIILIENKKITQFDGNYSKYLEEKQNVYDGNNDMNNDMNNDKNNYKNCDKNYYKVSSKKEEILSSNNKLLLEFKITKLESEIATTTDNNKKEELINKLNTLKENYQKL